MDDDLETSKEFGLLLGIVPSNAYFYCTKSNDLHFENNS